MLLKAFVLIAALETASALDGEWGNWGLWMPDCSEAEAGAPIERNRQCNNPPPTMGGRDCYGPSAQYDNCAIDGLWSEWSAWSSCVAMCGEGASRRDRNCADPAPKYGGAACHGDATEWRNCTRWNFGSCAGECHLCDGFVANECHEAKHHTELTEPDMENYDCVCKWGVRATAAALKAGFITRPSPTGLTKQVGMDCTKDIDECATGMNGCTRRQMCQDEIGTYGCFCRKGYRIDKSGRDCTGSTVYKNRCRVEMNSYTCLCNERSANTNEDTWEMTYNSSTYDNYDAIPHNIWLSDRYHECFCSVCELVSGTDIEKEMSRCYWSKKLHPLCVVENIKPEKYPEISTNMEEQIRQLAYYLDAPAMKIGFVDEAQASKQLLYNAVDVIGSAVTHEEEIFDGDDLLWLLSRIDAAGERFMTMMEEKLPGVGIDIRWTERETGFELVLFHGKLDNTSYFDSQCGRAKIPGVVFSKENHPVFAFCIYDPLKNLHIELYDGLNVTTSITAMTTPPIYEQFTSNEIEINSPILTMSAYPTIYKFPEDEYIEFILPLFLAARGYYEPICTFLDVEKQAWRVKPEDTGCSVMWKNTTHVRCKCDHMTSYAIHMVEIFPPFLLLINEILRAVNSGGSIFCLISCMLVLFMFLAVDKLHFNAEKGVILTEAATIAVIQVIYTLGGKATDNEMMCQTFSFFMHMFGMMCFGALLAGCITVYFNTVQKSKTHWKNRLILAAAIIIVPVIVAMTTAAVNFNIYGGTTNCWLDFENPITILLLSPCIIFSFICVGLLIRCYWVLKKIDFDQDEEEAVDKATVLTDKVINKEAAKKLPSKRLNKLRHAKTQMIGQGMLLLLMSGSWTFGLLVVNFENIVFAYLAAVTNALQGFWVLLYLAFRQKEVRRWFCPPVPKKGTDWKAYKAYMKFYMERKVVKQLTEPTEPEPVEEVREIYTTDELFKPRAEDKPVKKNKARIRGRLAIEMDDEEDMPKEFARPTSSMSATSERPNTGRTTADAEAVKIEEKSVSYVHKIVEFIRENQERLKDEDVPEEEEQQPTPEPTMWDLCPDKGPAKQEEEEYDVTDVTDDVIGQTAGQEIEIDDDVCEIRARALNNRLKSTRYSDRLPDIGGAASVAAPSAPGEKANEAMNALKAMMGDIGALVGEDEKLKASKGDEYSRREESARWNTNKLPQL